MQKLAVALVVAAASTLGCSSGGGGGAGVGDSGAAPATSSPSGGDGRPPPVFTGEVAIKTLGFSGTLLRGQFTFLIHNGTDKAFDSITEVRIATTAGDLVYEAPCTNLHEVSALQVPAGQTSKVIKIGIETTSKSGAPRTTVAAKIPCVDSLSGSVLQSELVLSKADRPLSLTIEGIASDASPWKAMAPVE